MGYLYVTPTVTRLSLTQKHGDLCLRPYKVSKPVPGLSSSPRFHNHCNQALYRVVFAAGPITAWPTLRLMLCQRHVVRRVSGRFDSR